MWWSPHFFYVDLLWWSPVYFSSPINLRHEEVFDISYFFSCLCSFVFIKEHYGASRDPPEKSIPLCTLKSFPNQVRERGRKGDRERESEAERICEEMSESLRYCSRQKEMRERDREKEWEGEVCGSRLSGKEREWERWGKRLTFF